MANAVAVTISLITGTVIVVNGVFMRTDDIIGKATQVVNQANIHQIATVLELYYLDHGSYPRISGGNALIKELGRGGYIRTRPLNPSVFLYSPSVNGEDYSLTLREEDEEG